MVRRQGEQAAAHYIDIFPDSEILGFTRYGAGSPEPEGSVMTVDFSLDGQRYVGSTAGRSSPSPRPSPFRSSVQTRTRSTTYWARLPASGQEGPCRWLKGRFGVSWQVVPTVPFDLVGDPDPGRAQRATPAMLGMGKIAEMRQAVDQAPT